MEGKMHMTPRPPHLSDSNRRIIGNNGPSKRVYQVWKGSNMHYTATVPRVKSLTAALLSVILLGTALLPSICLPLHCCLLICWVICTSFNQPLMTTASTLDRAGMPLQAQQYSGVKEPEAYQAFFSSQKDLQIPGGRESFNQLSERSMAALKEIASRHKVPTNRLYQPLVSLPPSIPIRLALPPAFWLHLPIFFRGSVMDFALFLQKEWPCLNSSIVSINLARNVVFLFPSSVGKHWRSVVVCLTHRLGGCQWPL